MFKLHKHKSDKSKDKFDFKFSDFQAIKVPKGWDKLFVSLVSVETGKTISKSGKTSVRNGTCRWMETFLESLYISLENGDLKDFDGCLFKFVVAMGSSRSGILGEATINLVDYASSRTSTPLSLQLKKCNYGTSLQLKVQCLTPKTRYRDAQLNETNTDVEYGNTDHDDVETKSDASDGAFSRSAGSMSSNHMESGSISQVALSRDPSFSASDSRNSFDSTEASSAKDMFSPQTNLHGAVDIGRQNTIEPHSSGASHSFRAIDDAHRSNNASLHTRTPESLILNGHREERNSTTYASPFSNTGSSKDLFEAAEVTIEELKAESRMWERNAKKLAADMNVLKDEVSEKSRSLTTLSMELSASQHECYDLKLEIRHLKRSLEESAKKEDATKDLKIQAEDMDDLQKEMDEEIRFLKESNANLTEQLQKTQESNIELLSILQELEGIIETQKLEMENLSSQKLNLEETEKLGPRDDVFATKSQFCDSNLEGSKVVLPVQHPDEQSPEGIDNMKLQLQQLHETQEELESAMQLLDKTVEEKDNEIERERDFRVKALLDSESKWSLQVAAKDEEIMNLTAKLSGAVNDQQNQNLEVETGGETNMVKKIRFLEGKVKNLEKDCNELTKENLELLVKLKEPRNDILLPDTLVGSSDVSPDEYSPCTCGIEISHLKAQLLEFQRELRSKEALVEEATTSAQSQVQCQDLENKCTELEFQLLTYREKAAHLEDELQEFYVRVEEQKIEIHALQGQLKQFEGIETETAELPLMVPNCTEGDHREEEHDHELVILNKHAHCSQELGISDTSIYSAIAKDLAVKAGEVEALKLDSLQKNEEHHALTKQIYPLDNQIVAVHDDKRVLEEIIESLEREKAVSSENLEKLKSEVLMLSSSVESHASASKVLERLTSELERGKEDVEQQLSELEKENLQLSERISALEAQLRYLTNEKETCHFELRYSESQSVNLRDEIGRLETEMEAQKVEIKQKLQEMNSRWLEAQKECEYLKKANPKLLSTTENLIEECASLQIFNRELKRQNMELHTRCTIMESQLRDSQGRFSECLQKVEALEAELSMTLEEVFIKEKSLNSELESLIIKDNEHKEKLMQENISLNHICSQKVVEVENLQRELAHLIDQISAAHGEKETGTSEAIFELSSLRADKSKLEAALQDLQGKLSLCQSKLSTLESKSEARMQELIRELTASRKNQEVLMSDHDKFSAMLETFRSSEGKYKSIISGLEIRIKTSEYERQLLDDEISGLRVKMQRATLLQDEVLAVKTSLSEANFEYERVKASLDLLQGDHEELKSEKDSLVQKISTMEKAQMELEECQHSKIALQEKILRLEGDLAAREALSAQDAELKFELSRIRRANGELQRTVKYLEQDQEGHLITVQALEEQLKQRNQPMQDQIMSAGNPSFLDDSAFGVGHSSRDEKQLIGIPGSENADYKSKVQSLENELAEALEANNMYKAQLRRFLSEEQNNCSITETSGSDRESEIKKHESSISSLEIELRDLRERYSQMSLKYAEVEAQREDLVRKLKSQNNRRSWFS